jgi:hypothetical protein
MKLFLSLVILVLPALAKADLSCQGFNHAGQKIPVYVAIYFTPQRSGIRQDATGALVGAQAGTAYITALGNQKVEFTSAYIFANEQTRCVAGQTISTSGSELSINLWVFNACVHTPVDSFQGYKGTLTLNEPDGVQSIYVACQDVAQR